MSGERDSHSKSVYNFFVCIGDAIIVVAAEFDAVATFKLNAECDADAPVSNKRL